MSVLIKDMEIPSECEYCGLCRYYRENGNVWCNATNRLLKQNWKNPDWTHLDVKRPDWCPLVEIPLHGRLVDADALIALVNDSTILGDGFKQAFCALVTGEPTVIEAEKGDE